MESPSLFWPKLKYSEGFMAATAVAEGTMNVAQVSNAVSYANPLLFAKSFERRALWDK
jgi:hypothetical protein